MASALGPAENSNRKSQFLFFISSKFIINIFNRFINDIYDLTRMILILKNRELLFHSDRGTFFYLWWSVPIFCPMYIRISIDFNSYATKKCTLQNSCWSYRTKGIDFAILTRDKAMPEWRVIKYGQKSTSVTPNFNFRFSCPVFKNQLQTFSLWKVV